MVGGTYHVIGCDICLRDQQGKRTHLILESKLGKHSFVVSETYFVWPQVKQIRLVRCEHKNLICSLTNSVYEICFAKTTIYPCSSPQNLLQRALLNCMLPAHQHMAHGFIFVGGSPKARKIWFWTKNVLLGKNKSIIVALNNFGFCEHCPLHDYCFPINHKYVCIDAQMGLMKSIRFESCVRINESWRF